MNNKPLKKELPPAIRVFLSSTFSDMEAERTCFNEEIVPELTRLCSQRGISFFSVDLRWGITEQEQTNGKVLPICLSEIDKCRPFFIGILGDRYGSVVDSVPDDVKKSIPWLENKEGKSITELEMLYAVLDREKNTDTGNAAFYLRSHELSVKMHGDTVNQQMTALKNTIANQKMLKSSTYNSIDEFKQQVYRDIISWIEKEFPSSCDVKEKRIAWYNGEYARNYIENSRMTDFLNAYVTETNHSLILNGDGGRGKTAFLTNWEPERGRKILINCGSDNDFLYWPSIAKRIVSEINGISKQYGAPGSASKVSFVQNLIDSYKGQKSTAYEFSFFETDAERENYRLAFLKWLKELSLKEDVYIVINDMNLLSDNDSIYMSWLPSVTQKRLHIICSTNNETTIENAELLGWNCKEMPLFDNDSAKELVLNYLHNYGKNLEQAQVEAVVGSFVSAFPGQLRFIMDFLINYGRFDNLNSLLNEALSQRNIRDIYSYIYKHITATLSDEECRGVRAVFSLLHCSRYALNEQQCYELVKKIVSINNVQWANMRYIFELFGFVNGDYWNIRNEEVKKFASEIPSADELQQIHNMLGNAAYAVFKDKEDIREKTEQAEASLYHFEGAKNYSQLKTVLTDEDILLCLVKLNRKAVRTAWVSIIRYSDIDVPGELMALLGRLKGRQSEWAAVTDCVTSLFIDLEFRTYVKKACRLTGNSHINSDLADKAAEYSDEFIMLHRYLNSLKEQFKYREIYKLLTEHLSDIDNKPYSEQCELMFFLCNSEINLKMHKKGLEDINRYYEVAIKSASVYELRRALQMKGDVLLQLNLVEDCEKINKKVQKLALEQGDIRSYLGAKNIQGLCLNRRGKCREALECFEECHGLWTKLDNKREVMSVLLNKCASLYFDGDCESAYKLCYDGYSELTAGEDENLKFITASFVGNLAKYALELNKTRESEKFALECISYSKKVGSESTMLNAMYVLITLYEKEGSYIKALEIYKQMFELFWLRENYEGIANELAKVIILLHSNHAGYMVPELMAEWEEKFSKIPGGKEYLEGKLKTTSVDNVQVNKLKEELILTKASGDKNRYANVLAQLAVKVMEDNPREAIRYLIEAVTIYKETGDKDEENSCLENAVANVCRYMNEQQYLEILGLIDDNRFKDFVQLWKNRGSSVSAKEFFSKASEIADNRPYLYFSFLYDNIEYLVTLSAEDVIACIKRLSGNYYSRFGKVIKGFLLNDINKDISYLMENYSGADADLKLNYYEKAVEILDALDMEEPGLYGNLAVIFRRKRNEEKTIAYHTKSMNGYKKQNNTKDYLIEVMNFATACKEFNNKKMAIELLRDGIKEAEKANEQYMMSCMAGNLAGFLIEQDAKGNKQEIISCFAVEERWFRENRIARELAISLLNQVMFYRGAGGDGAVAKAKLKEAGEVIREHKLKEFEGTLNSLENTLAVMPAGCQEMADNIKALVSCTGKYEVKHIQKSTTGEFRVFCDPIEAVSYEREVFILDVGKAENKPVAMFTFVHQSVLKNENAADELEKYAAWWNEYKDYTLKFDRQKFIMEARRTLVAEDWQGLCTEYKRLYELWSKDKMCINMCVAGLIDFNGCVEIKSK